MNERHTFPFTSSQWQELEHQALIFKYMACGIPIPPDLLYSIKRSFDPSSISSKFLSRQATHVGWNYIPTNSGKKLDLEPSRCRRTDGKKWRCSKEVYPNSKYCERHMHRGKNRSRKPVETPAQTPLSSISRNTSSPFLHPQHGSYSRTPRLDFSHEDHTTNLLLNSNSYSQTNPDYRYIYGLKEEVDEHEHAFFSEPSGTIRSFSSSSSSMDDSWELAPLTMSSSSSKHHKHDHQSYDLKMDREPQKTIHHFFDEWPPKNRASSSWLDVEDKPITQLSISIPTLDFPIFGSRNYNDG